VKAHIFLLCLTIASGAKTELRVPAFTAYLEPDPNGAQVSEANGITGWHDKDLHIAWFGELKAAGKLTASVELKLPAGATSKLQLTVGGESHQAEAKDGTASFGEYTIGKPGYVRFELTSLNGANDAGQIGALVLNGTAVEGAHFNMKPRRNAASVHLAYPTPAGAEITMFYNEVTAVEDPNATFYMACGFHRGYLGMQVISPAERRIIFSVWDAASGGDAHDRSTVEAENHVQMLTKGELVVAKVFGNEGTGGHSHLAYPWKTGERQKFLLAAKPGEGFTDYSGYYFHPEKGEWTLLATFRAPKDGGWLKSLYSFSEDFNENTGQLLRKALYGPQWVAMADGEWLELTKATFSHDVTGKSDRLDRFMGVENGKFFLSQGGFLPGTTNFGDPFTRPASGAPPQLPKSLPTEYKR